MQRDSSWTRRSSTWPGTKRVDARRVSSGAGPSLPKASTDTSTSAAPAPEAESVFSQGCGNGAWEPFGGLMTSSVTTLPPTLMTTWSDVTMPPVGSLWMPTTSCVGSLPPDEQVIADARTSEGTQAHG